ncbi:MAG TPA: glycoside hydrolase family 3 N-terminal domain-containing protein [Flavobacterium sp.]|uniref:glycoside hydrolase family 3 N-terminal domain-containing protein n=1 Tax=Flavobacterium sp. TaxID=239 RepID=UPI002B4B1457|nr:glycoside hydrolase family 3 N-terminal domain-containing protein [Flavobacterium sp.]HLO72638.1 glycoside hydrolase family 3 N-terminal domain-containing protein [Flavobacterium sp.]
MRYILIFILFSIVSFGQKKSNLSQEVWVDSVYNQLSFDEKVGQLFMVAAYSNKDEAHNKSIDKLIEENKIGGLIFFQGGPVRQAKLTNRYQAKSKVPLFIGIDAEWGLSMRLDSTYRYPWNMTLGAIQDMKLIEKTGNQMAKQSKRMGIHFNFAPVVDINTNPKNPIIGNRSFGETKENVTLRALALMKGLQDEGVYATAKHFPGHGDTSTDSHHTLPTVQFDKNRLDDVELYPYKELIKNGLTSVMVAHLNVPSIEPRENYPTSISYNVVTNILKNELQFNGLIFTDALNMKGASNFKKPGDIDLEAFLAGNDILLFAENVPVAIKKFNEAKADGRLTEERLAYSVKKILAYKYKANLQNYQPIVLENLYNDLNTVEYDALNYQLYENAVTVIKNETKSIPIAQLDKEKIAYVKLGNDSSEVFVTKLKSYANVTEITSKNLDSVLVELQDYTKVIIGYHKSDGAWRNHNLTFRELLWINQIAKQNDVILTFFTKPYSLLTIKNFESVETIIVGYQNNAIAQTVVPQVIFGAIGSKGKLPVSIEEHFKVNEGIETLAIQRLGFEIPENVGMNSKILTKIDSIAKYAIDKKMTPGLQVVVARKGKVVYQKSFGNHTYEDGATKVQNTDLYDIASLTKIIGTLPNIMQEFDKGNLTLESKLKMMLPVFKGSNKEDATVLDMLTHQARFQPWIPFYKATLDSLNKPSEKYYRTRPTVEFQLKVAEDLYLRRDYNDTIIKIIADSELLSKKQYKYSDFSFILFKEYLEKQNGKTLEYLAKNNFYNQLGATSITYNPLHYFDRSVVVPTENDNYFRYQPVHGYVHDMAAAMQGGISGHAGLFSNALDIAKVMQMYLQKGNYGGMQFITEATLQKFNTCYFCKDGNRRGVGFDKPQLGNEGPTCGCVSLTSFGHTGFTGTMTWADPEKEIVYVFLSNRTYPDSNATNKLSKENIRENIQKVIYESIIE